ncbi:substrate-binding periplasmic protein [Chitinibacter tainanensis]|uniref:substrate-binding periplasmic protein n=1 Tax=Chitinibacter tainanensis TaxID=230667 RepID=UPI0004128B76|nr:transporter substrate-binding domain-containing protein [Chitinibacter tainanensis]
MLGRSWLLICYFSGLAASQAAEPLRVAMGISKMPYVSMEAQNGIEYELITRPLLAAGYTLDVQHMPNKRAQTLLERGELDAVISLSGNYLSQPYIRYQNMAISRCANQVKLPDIAALSRYQVGAFHGASRFLGPELAQIAENRLRYQELADQKLLNRMLAIGHLDVVISDINIFRHFEAGVQPTGPICPVALFAPTDYRLAFRQAPVRDAFDRELAKLRRQGLYEELNWRYLRSKDAAPFKPQ